MCPQCQKEYDDPLNRRFHAQPNACWTCGPQLQLWDNRGNFVACDDPIAATAERLSSGSIVAVKGLGGFHLAADATKEEAVRVLRERKRRIGKPFAIMARHMDAVRRICRISTEEEQTLLSPQRPIVLLEAKDRNGIASDVAPGNRYLGVFLPYTPIHHLLFTAGSFDSLIMTSGNLSEEPIAIANREAVDRLGDLADYLLVHNRDILCRCDDSVVRWSAGKLRQVRRSRGFVPVPVFLKHPMKSVMAVGGELKNTICLTRDTQAFLSQHVGDLENLEAYNFFQETVRHLQQLLEINPSAIAYDLHPDYLSTKWALAQKELPTIGVQHHHAHIASCMAENHVEGPVIGIALDGTGYGTDGAIWGGEILVCDARHFTRVAHLAYTPMPGGEAAIHHPWRMALSYLWQEFGAEMMDLRLPFLRAINPNLIDLTLRILKRRIHAPLTSSCGRLFDAVAAIAGLRLEVSYEAQAAIELEMCIDRHSPAVPYDFELVSREGKSEIRYSSFLRQLVRDVLDEVSPGVISRKFHDGLAYALSSAAVRIRDQFRLEQVCLSGGTFQNAYFAAMLENLLHERGFKVFTQAEVPCGDGGLSLGQAFIAAATLGSSQTGVRNRCCSEADRAGFKSHVFVTLSGKS